MYVDEDIKFNKSGSLMKTSGGFLSFFSIIWQCRFAMCITSEKVVRDFSSVNRKDTKETFKTKNSSLVII